MMQPMFDEELEAIVEEIDTKYRVGMCPDHPDDQCFHHRLSGNHFILDRTKKLCWASKIVGFVDLILILPSSFSACRENTKPHLYRYR